MKNCSSKSDYNVNKFRSRTPTRMRTHARTHTHTHTRTFLNQPLFGVFSGVDRWNEPKSGWKFRLGLSYCFVGTNRGAAMPGYKKRGGGEASHTRTFNREINILHQLTQLHFGQCSSLPLCLRSLIVQ